MSIWAAESKACNLQECKGMGLECANAIGDTKIFGVVPIGGAIVHPRWWRLQPTKGNGCTSPPEGSTHEGSTKKQPCVSHHGRRPRRTCLTRVDLQEVGDLLSLTNSLVQLHNLVGGSQVTPRQSRRHRSPRSNKWCVDDELLALVLQMIVSPTLNSLS